MSLWSWKMGIGTSVFSHADIAGDPFTYLIFMFGRDHIPDMFVWNQIARNIVATIVMYFYLSEFEIEKIVCMLGSVMYAFSGIQIFGNNFALGTVCVYAPVVLLGIEKFLKKNQSNVLMISLALTAIYSYYFYIGLGLMSAIYLTVRFVDLYGWNVKKLLLQLLKLLGMGILGIGVSFFLLYPQVLLTLKNARTDAGKDTVFGLWLFLPKRENILTAFVRMFDLNLLGEMVNQRYIGAFDYFTFATYTSAAAVPLIVQYYAYSNKKERKYIVLVIVLCVIGVSVPIFSYATNAFSTVNYRWNYILNILIVLGTCLGIQKILENDGFAKKWLYGSLAVLVVSISVSFFTIRQNYSELTWIEKRSIWNIAVIFGVLILLSVVIGKRSFFANYKRVTIILIIGTAFLWSAKRNYNYWFCDDFTLHGFTSAEELYEGADSKLINEIKENDDSFFRIDKSFDVVVDYNNIKSENDSMAQEYNGLRCYNSQNNPEYIKFLQNMGIPCTISFMGENALSVMDAQEIAITYVGNGYYVIRCPYTNVALEATEEGVVWNEYSGCFSQLWSIEMSEDNSVYITSVLNGKMLTVDDESWIVGFGADCLQENQEFYLDSLGDYTDLKVIEAKSSKDLSISSGLYKIVYKKNPDFKLTSDMSSGTTKMTADYYTPTQYNGALLNYISGVYNHYELMSYLGVKYYLTDSPNLQLPETFHLINERDGYFVYQNTAQYPLAFTTEYVMSQEQFSTMGTAAKEQRILNTVITENGTTSENWKATDICQSAKKKQNDFSLEKFSEDEVEFVLHVDENAQYIVMSIPYDKDWKVTIDDENVQTERVNGGLLGISTQEIQKEKDVRVKLSYAPTYLYIGGVVSAFSILLMCSIINKKRKCSNEIRK